MGNKSNAVSLAIGGIVLIGLVAAVGLHAADLAKLPKPAAQGFGTVLSTAETGNPPAGG